MEKLFKKISTAAIKGKRERFSLKMLNPQKLEKFYKEFIKDLPKWVQDGIVQVDLTLLKKFNLLNKTPEEEKEIQAQFPFYFHVIESDEKVALFNNQFIVWIVPKVVEDVPTTLTLIALVQKEKPRLEIAFSTAGVYNTPKYVLKVLRHFLTEVIDTEEEIASITKI
ncbi:MAG: hypothetical protein JSR76_01000 [Verrucomicrobia bacterium]|nr:hypothetical protein [Verrucomicrobiota bacterium]